MLWRGKDRRDCRSQPHVRHGLAADVSLHLAHSCPGHAASKRPLSMRRKTAKVPPSVRRTFSCHNARLQAPDQIANGPESLRGCKQVESGKIPQRIQRPNHKRDCGSSIPPKAATHSLDLRVCSISAQNARICGGFYKSSLSKISDSATSARLCRNSPAHTAEIPVFEETIGGDGFDRHCVVDLAVGRLALSFCVPLLTIDRVRFAPIFELMEFSP